jgi:4'-phosphopantetheinyl transferase
VLSRYLHRPPREIRFGENSFGKPFIEESDRCKAPQFNLSHAGELVLVAVCGSRRVGVDVEEIRPMNDLSSMAEWFCTRQERASIFHRLPTKAEYAFFRCWTRKEAFVKAVGKGLSIPLNSFDTLASNDLGLQRLDSGADSSDRATWELADLDVPEGYVAAVAVEESIDRLVYFRWPTNVMC